MRVTVCQWPDEQRELPQAWDRLVAHVREQSSELVLLPEMPFSPWFPASPEFDPDVWSAAVAAHDHWETRFPELGPTAVLGTRPLDFGNERYNEGFVWEKETGTRAAHAKAFLLDEEGVWETHWYRAATPEFTPVAVGHASIGFLICTEMWTTEQARTYGLEGVHLLVMPRITRASTHDLWLAAGRLAAEVAGTFALSSNRSGGGGKFGGRGWVISPDGEVLAVTSQLDEFVTVDVDLTLAERVAALRRGHHAAPPLPRH